MSEKRKAIQLLLLTAATTTFLLLFVSLANADADSDANGGDEAPTKKSQRKTGGPVTFDGRSLIINGKRELIFGGSVHYPRSTPDMWPVILKKAKSGGLNTIQTYVFWNVHEPEQGKFNFEGNYDLVAFLRLIQEHGMYVILRIGPFIQAEWNHGGLPYWLRTIPGITFRTNNGPWKKYMEKFVRMIVDKMKEEKLFAPQGGPIILAQIENEYNTIEPAFKEEGKKYVKWAGQLALDVKAGVPWVMCKQTDAPTEIINTCNGRHCGDTWSGPNNPNKPYLWTENWTAQFRVYGDPPSQRSAEDIAYAVTRFFSKNGTMTVYYMYHGGTNFGRTTNHFTTTRYYDEAPLDEVALTKEPKYGHLKDLHKSLNLCKKALMYGTPAVQKPTPDTEIRYYEQAGTGYCAAFLANNNTKIPATMKFRGNDYLLPPGSISILPDCNNVVFNSQQINSQHNLRSYSNSQAANKNLDWKMYKEPLPGKLSNRHQEPLELYDLTKDVSDYAWYSTEMELAPRDLPMKHDSLPILRIASLGHGLHAWLNGEYAGHAHGSKVEKGFMFQKPVNFVAGVNQILILAYSTGYADSGPYMERRYIGPRSISALGLNTGTLDLTVDGWGHEAGLEGEKNHLFDEEGADKVKWTKAEGPSPALTWFKTYFDAPEGKKPVVVTMTGMGKGQIWINGKGIGRYWMSYLSPLKLPTQAEYHIPRAWIKPKKNLMVIFEEENGMNPKDIAIQLVDRDTICSFVTDQHPPPVKTWEVAGGQFKNVGGDTKPSANLKCGPEKKMIAVDFAAYGDPDGFCGSFTLGNCTSPASKQVVEQQCLGKSRCKVLVDPDMFDPKKSLCPGTPKSLAVQVRCG